MQLPASAELARWLAIPMGLLFGVLPQVVFWLIETRVARPAEDSNHSTQT